MKNEYVDTEELTLDKPILNVVDESKLTLRMKGSEKFIHHLSKLEVATMQRNNSYKANQIQLEPIEHAHFHHSVDRKGEKNQYCVPVGGHFHEVTLVGADEDGYPVYECGPALRKVHKLTKGKRQVVEIEPVTFWDDSQGREYVDSHTHKVTYKNSEEIWPDKMAQQAQQDARKLQLMMAAAKK